VPVSYRDVKGDLRHAQARVIDFDDPDNAEWKRLDEQDSVPDRG
jgi:hypothetical protein